MLPGLKSTGRRVTVGSRVFPSVIQFAETTSPDMFSTKLSLTILTRSCRVIKSLAELTRGTYSRNSLAELTRGTHSRNSLAELTRGTHSRNDIQVLERIFNLNLSVVLLIGAVLKSHHLSHGVNADGLHQPVGLLIAAVVVECVVSAVLLVARCGYFTRRVVFIVFAVLTMFSLGQVWAGQRVCGCFGVFSVPPIYVFLFDASAIGGIMIFAAPVSQGNWAKIARLCPVILTAMASVALIFTGVIAHRGRALNTVMSSSARSHSHNPFDLLEANLFLLTSPHRCRIQDRRYLPGGDLREFVAHVESLQGEATVSLEVEYLSMVSDDPLLTGQFSPARIATLHDHT